MACTGLGYLNRRNRISKKSRSITQSALFLFNKKNLANLKMNTKFRF
jgi:hypothetical protein